VCHVFLFFFSSSPKTNEQTDRWVDRLIDKQQKKEKSKKRYVSRKPAFVGKKQRRKGLNMNLHDDVYEDERREREELYSLGLSPRSHPPSHASPRITKHTHRVERMSSKQESGHEASFPPTVRTVAEDTRNRAPIPSSSLPPTHSTPSDAFFVRKGKLAMEIESHVKKADHFRFGRHPSLPLSSPSVPSDLPVGGAHPSRVGRGSSRKTRRSTCSTQATRTFVDSDQVGFLFFCFFCFFFSFPLKRRGRAERKSFCICFFLRLDEMGRDSNHE